MKCPRCQHENPPQSRFCLECGADLALRCASCGTELPAGAKFCNQCGQAAGAPAAVGAGPASPNAYTPKHLAEKILTSRGALEGERKQVTVLFCDIADSSGLAQRLDPEGMHEVMDRALRLMAEAVHRYEGTVNQFLGDGVMALFGAPVALEDHAFRAVQAALAIQETRDYTAVGDATNLAARRPLTGSSRGMSTVRLWGPPWSKGGASRFTSTG